MTTINFETSEQARRLLANLRDTTARADLAIHNLAAYCNEVLPPEGAELEITSEIAQRAYDLINDIHDRLREAVTAEDILHALANSVFVNANGVYLPFGGGEPVKGLHDAADGGPQIQLKSGGTNKSNDPPKAP